MADSPQAPWVSLRELHRHFLKHGVKLGTTTETDYDASARGTIRAGRRFTYADPDTSKPRVGYYDLRTDRFTAMNATETRILSHFRISERYVRNLPGSDYRR